MIDQRSLLCIPFAFGVIYSTPAVLHNTLVAETSVFILKIYHDQIHLTSLTSFVQ